MVVSGSTEVQNVVDDAPRLDNPLDPVHRKMTWEFAKRLGRTMETWDLGRFYNMLVVLSHQTSV